MIYNVFFFFLINLLQQFVCSSPITCLSLFLQQILRHPAKMIMHSFPVYSSVSVKLFCIYLVMLYYQHSQWRIYTEFLHTPCFQ